MSDKSKPAFPRPAGEWKGDFDHIVNNSQPGMTLREYYAGLAMQGILATYTETALAPAFIAMQAVDCADALIAELGKEQQ